MKYRIVKVGEVNPVYRVETSRFGIFWDLLTMNTYEKGLESEFISFERATICLERAKSADQAEKDKKKAMVIYEES